jgi:biopolymer transport protein ExbD
MAFSTNGTSRNSGLSSEINVTPLIDVLLVMLIIFMMIVPEMPRGLNSTLPSAANRGADEAADRRIVVEVKSGMTTVRYVVDGADVERAELVPHLAKLLSQTSVRQVLLKADASLDFAVIAGVIEAGQAAGAESVGLMTPQTERPSR